MNSLIHPERVNVLAKPTLAVYRYKRVLYSPLEKENARKCLRSLVVGIKAALEEMHKCSPVRLGCRGIQGTSWPWVRLKAIDLTH